MTRWDETINGIVWRKGEMVGRRWESASGVSPRAEAESWRNGPAEGRKRFSISTVNGGHALISGRRKNAGWRREGRSAAPLQPSGCMEYPQRKTCLIGVGTRKQ